MCSYTIIAVITKINDERLYFKGVGDYLEKIDFYQRNILLSGGEPKYRKIEESYFELKDTGNLTSDALYRELFVRSMLDKKPLKLTIEENADPLPPYKVVAVEVP